MSAKLRKCGNIRLSVFTLVCVLTFKLARDKRPLHTDSNKFIQSSETWYGSGSHRSTVVTAYFRMDSKHSQDQYDAWMKNFLTVDDAMVIFTSSDLVQWITSQRGTKYSHQTHIVELELSDLRVARMFPTSFWEHQLDIDPEKAIHQSYELFWVWLNKPFFVTDAIYLNPFRSDIFAWSDIGCYRDDSFNGKKWLKHTDLISENRILAMAWREPKDTGVQRFVKSEHEPSGDWFMGGSQLVGYAETWKLFARSLTTVLHQYAKDGLFIGDDQPIFQTVCRQEDLCEYVRPGQVSIDTFFGLQEILHFGGISKPWYAMKSTGHRETLQPPNPCENDDFSPQSEVAFFTLLTDDANYVTGAVKLGESVLQHTTIPVDRVYMELNSKVLPDALRKRLKESGWKRCTVRRIAPLDEEGTFGRFKDQFTKLHAWGMTAYERILYADSDTLVLKSIDHLLQLDLSSKRIAVARDFGDGLWRPTFNMGVFVIQPNSSEYSRLLRLQQDSSIEFETAMCEQGFLNVIYRDEWEDIGFQNNANLAVYAQSRAYWDEHESEINIVHYTMNKPWECTDAYRVPCSWW